RAALLSPRYAGVRRDPQKAALARSMLSGWSGADWRDTTVYPKPARLQIQRLGGLRVPALVMIGENDPPMFHEVAEVLAGGLTVVRKAIVPGAGHMSPIENPE